MKHGILEGITVGLLFMSCSESALNRDDAREVIQKHYNFPIAYVDYVSTARSSMKDYGEYKTLAEQGLVTIREQFFQHDLIPTPKGQRYFINRVTVVACSLTLDSITGVMLDADAKHATIEFTLRVDQLTPFGEVFAEGSYPRGIRGHRWKAEAERFDDGWRLSDNGDFKLKEPFMAMEKCESAFPE